MTSVAMHLYVIGYLLAFGFEAMTLQIRVAGAQLGRNAYAGFLVTACLLGNRLGASLLFPSGGFLLDKAYPTSGFLNLFSLSAVIMSVILVLMIVNQTRVVTLLRALFPSQQTGVAVVAEKADESPPSEKELSRYVIALTTTLNQLGILLPVLVASMFLDYRATIVQMGFLINSVGTVISIFYVEKKIALYAEFSPDQLDRQVAKVLSAKAAVVFTLGAMSLGGATLLNW